MKRLISSCISKFKLFSKDTSGQIAIMVATLMVPMTLMIGAGIDWSQQLTATNKMQTTMDSAILAVARALSVDKDMTQSELEAVATTIFNTNIDVSQNVSLDQFAITYSNDVLHMTQSGTLQTAFLKIASYDTMSLNVSSTVNMKFRGVDLALAVDLSGSMWGSKISHLRSATDSLLDELSNANVTEMRVSFIPWTRGVNVGSYYDSLLVDTPEPYCQWHYSHYWGWYEQCEPITDCLDAPADGLIPNDIGAHPDIRDCPSAKLIPLTDLATVENGKTGKQRLQDIAATWGADGGTGSHLGMYWAWTTLTSAFNNIYGITEPEDPETIQKYAIIMTDGENNAGSFNTRMLATCTAMKEQGIHIYTIVLMQSSQTVLNTFRDCASPDTPSRNYFIQTSDSALLQADFEKIAQEIGQFYLSS